MNLVNLEYYLQMTQIMKKYLFSFMYFVFEAETLTRKTVPICSHF